MSNDLTPQEAREVFLLGIFYRSPWDRLAGLLWTGWPTGTSLTPDGSWRDRLATWCDQRDRRWIARYARRGRPPSRIWRR